ncbi:hypothetical protein NRA10_19065 [Acinetobacter baumannii]|nr:hypothetical protein [Acinetobacter baumannii]
MATSASMATRLTWVIAWSSGDISGSECIVMFGILVASPMA